MRYAMLICGVEDEWAGMREDETRAAMDQIGWDGQSRPTEQLRRATSLEEAVANPLPGTSYGV